MSFETAHILCCDACGLRRNAFTGDLSTKFSARYAAQRVGWRRRVFGDNGLVTRVFDVCPVCDRKRRAVITFTGNDGAPIRWERISCPDR